MLDHPQESKYAKSILNEVVKELTNADEISAEFQRRLVIPISEKFISIYKANNAEKGFVSIQGDPIHEDDPDVIIKQALVNRKVGPNICCKIPTTKAGLIAMEYLVTQDVPLNATEIFGISQGIALCETYQKVSRKSGKHPKLYISHIAGIYDDHLRNVVQKEGIDISPDILWQAGLSIARKLYRLIEERDYPGIFIAGGARGLHHFTEMVGAEACCTINWEGTADRLIEQDPPVVYRFFNPVPAYVIDELMDKLPDFKRGYLEDGLSIDEFEAFGPVQLFRSSFIQSWKKVLARIEQIV
jgi:transaldolase